MNSELTAILLCLLEFYKYTFERRSKIEHYNVVLLSVVLRYMTLIQQITAFYEDNFPEVMKNILVIKGVFLIFLKLLFSAIFDQHFTQLPEWEN